MSEFPILIWVFIVIVIAVSKKRSGEGKANRRRYNGVENRPAPKPASPSRPRPVKPAASQTNAFADNDKALNKAIRVQDQHNHTFGSLSAVLEDRKNDWLAKQLREEARHKNDYR